MQMAIEKLRVRVEDQPQDFLSGKVALPPVLESDPRTRDRVLADLCELAVEAIRTVESMSKGPQ